MARSWKLQPGWVGMERSCELTDGVVTFDPPNNGLIEITVDLVDGIGGVARVFVPESILREWLELVAKDGE